MIRIRFVCDSTAIRPRYDYLRYKLSSAVSSSSVSVYQMSLWLAAPNFLKGKIRQCENLLLKYTLAHVSYHIW